MKKIRILFVCLGNICRSPMAEYVMKKLACDAGLESCYEIASAAVSSEEAGNPVYPPARRMLAAHGISCEGHAARKIRRDEYEKWDHVIGMDDSNLRMMLRIFGGDPEGKCSLLLSWAGRADGVADPWYTGDFDATWTDVLEGCRAVLMKTRPDAGKEA